MQPAIPEYRRIADDIRRQIEDGELQPGDRLPTKRDLAVAYGVGTRTVESALLVLRAQGLIRGHQGRGLFVTQPPAAR